MTDLPRDIESELAALADGSLAPERRERALARVNSSRDLRDALAEQRRAVELTAAVETRAPASLHRQVEAMLSPAEGKRGRKLTTPRRIGFAAAIAAALVVVVIASGALSRGDSSGLSVQQAAALTLSSATGPAPRENESHRSQLTVAVDGVSFPYWKERFGWRSSGTRSDRIDGRSVTTVFYTNSEGGRIGYAIASGHAPVGHGGTVVRRWGVSYRLLTHDGATVVTWQRGGHLCVMSGRGVSARTLVSLASWDSQKARAA